MAVALLALFVALGGVGYAAVKIHGKNIKNRTVAGKKLKRNTLSGKEIKESRLAKVRSAKQADSARLADTARNAGSAGSAQTAARAGSAGNADTVGGARIRSFRYTSASAAPERDVFVLDGFRLRAECSSGSGLLLRFASPGGPARVSVGQAVDPQGDGIGSGAAQSEVAVPDGNLVSLPNLETHRATGTMMYMRADRTIGVQYRTDESGAGAPPCEFQGVATSAPTR